MSKQIIATIILAGLFMSPIAARGEEAEVHWFLETYRVPDAIEVGDMFRMEILVDAEGNEAARELYNETTFTLRFNITLSDGLKWKWQSQTASLTFWISFIVYKVSYVITPKLDIAAFETGFQEIFIEIQPEPEIGNIIRHKLGLWVLPEAEEAKEGFGGVIREYWGFVAIGVAFLLGIGIATIPPYLAKRRRGKTNE